MKILILLFVSLFFITIQQVDAAQYQYGIALSKTCLTMIKNNLTTNCPTYDEIMLLFPDTTDQNRSGEFQIIDGITQRGKAQMIDSQRFYDFSPISPIWVDPPGDVRSKIRMITIYPSIPQFKIGAESIKMDDYNITFGIDRYVDKYCREASITAKDWVFLTGDTMRLLQNKCDPSFTTFKGTITHTFAQKYQDIATSSKYKLAQFVLDAKEKYKVSHIGSNDVNENKSVIEDEDEK